MKIKQEDGTEVEVFTQADVDAKLTEKETAIKTEYEQKLVEKDTTLSTLTKDKEELEKKLLDTNKDNPNFKILKEALDKKDKDLADLRNEISNDKAKMKNDLISTKIKSIARGDEELSKKIKLHLETSVASMKDSTEEELDAKVRAAVKLSLSGDDSPGMFDGGTAGGAGKGGEFGGSRSGVEFTAREKALGAKLGITDEDYKKYGNRLNKK